MSQVVCTEMSELSSYLDIEVNFISFVFLIRYSRTRNSQRYYRKLFLHFGSKFSRRSSSFVACLSEKIMKNCTFVYNVRGAVPEYFSSPSFIIIITILVMCQEKIMEDRAFVYSVRALFLNILVADFKNSLL